MAPHSRRIDGWIGLLALVIIGMMLLTACGGGEASGQVGRDGGSEITWQVWGDPEEIAVYEAMVEGYEASHPGRTVKLNTVPSQGDFMTKLSGSLTAGNPPDVFMVNYRRYAQFVEKDVLEPVGPYVEKSDAINLDDFFEVPLEAFTWEGTLECLPFNMSSLVVYYNVDLFRQHNVPLPESDWTWDDFLAAAKALTLDTDGDGTTDLYGLGFDPSVTRVAPFIWSNGGDLLAEGSDDIVTLDTQPTREALQFFVDLNLKHHVAPSEAEFAAQDPESQFMEGKIAMTLNSRRATPIFRSIEGFTWDVAPPPAKVRQASTLHSDAFCIAAASEDKEAAWSFIEYALSGEGQEIAGELGRTVPPTKSIANSEVFLDPAKPPASSQVFLDLGPKLELLPILPEWPAIEKILNEELYVAFFGHKSLDDAIDTANQMIAEEQAR